MTESGSRPVHWSGTGQLRGGRRGISFFITALRILGLRATYALSVPVAAYFTFVSPDVRATMDYHRRVFGPQPGWKRRWLVFRHFLSFGRALIDRTAILAGDTHHLSFTFDGEDHLRQALAEGHGVLLLTAHLGNWEAAGKLLSRLEVPVNVAGFDKETAEIRTLLDQVSRAKFRLLPLTGSPTDTIPLVAALRRGEVVAMMGDRPYGSPAARIPFLGGTASFPVGAYVMAAIAGAPLVHVFNVREPGGHYHFFGFPPQHPQMPPHNRRDAYLQECVERFTRDLKSILRRDPLQWYNFYPFWDEPEPRPQPQPDAMDALIPHRPPMRWINALTHCDSTTARATACFPAGHFAVADGLVAGTALVECVAQTVAAAQAKRAASPKLAGPTRGGMLAAVSRFRIESNPQTGRTLQIEVRELKRFGPMLLVHGAVSCEGRQLASGELTLYA